MGHGQDQEGTSHGARTRVRLQTQNCKNMLSLLYELLRTVVAPLEPRCVGFAFGRFEALLFRCSEGLH